MTYANRATLRYLDDNGPQRAKDLRHLRHEWLRGGRGSLAAALEDLHRCGCVQLVAGCRWSITWHGRQMLRADEVARWM